MRESACLIPSISLGIPLPSCKIRGRKGRQCALYALSHPLSACTLWNFLDCSLNFSTAGVESPRRESGATQKEGEGGSLSRNTGRGRGHGPL